MASQLDHEPERKESEMNTLIDWGEDAMTGDETRPNKKKDVDELYDPLRDDWFMIDRWNEISDYNNRDDLEDYDRFVFLDVRQYDKCTYSVHPEHFMSKNGSFQTFLDIRSPQLKKVCKDVMGVIPGILGSLTPFRVSNIFFFHSPDAEHCT